MTATPSPRRSSEPDWKQFLRLGEQLVQQGTTKSQCLLIEQLTQELLGGSARVWLSRPIYPLPDEDREIESPSHRASPGSCPTSTSRSQIAVFKWDNLEEQAPDNGNPVWIAAVPFITNQRLLGVLQVEREPATPFDPNDIDPARRTGWACCLGPRNFS